MPSCEIVCDKRVCFWGAPRQIGESARLIERSLVECGQNTGNLFIGSGLFDGLRAPVKSYWDFYLQDPREFDDMFDVLFIPASNFLFENTDLADQYEFFAKTKAQILMFGLGSQTKEVGPIHLKNGTLKFLNLVQERSASIGVRGEVTAEIMYQMGFSNVEVVGCPSMLTIPNSYKSMRQVLSADLIAGNFTNNAREHSFDADTLARIEGVLFKDLVKRRGFYVLQNERHELQARQYSSLSEKFNPEEIFHLQTVDSLFQAGMHYEKMASFLVRRSKVFWERDEWVRFMSQMDFSFGTRFHGNVAALLAGTPCFVLCHDYRTLELCQFYKIPHLSIRDCNQIESIADILPYANMDEFLSNFSNLIGIWTSFVRRNGFETVHTLDGSAS